MRYFFTLLLIATGLVSSYAQDGANRQPTGAVVAFTYSVRPGCNGDEVILNNTTRPGAGSYRFYWDFGDGSATDGEHTNPIHTYHAPGNVGKYTITLTYTSTDDATKTASYSQEIVINHPLDAHIATIPEASSVCWQVPMNFTAATASPLEPSYTWDMGDGTKINGNATEYTYANPGNYNVTLTVTDKLGCSQTTTTKVQVVKITAHTVTHDTDVCLKEPMPLRAYAVVEPANIAYNIEWSPTEQINNANSADATFFGVGEFNYVVTASTTYPYCMATDAAKIHSYQPVTLTNVTASQTIQAGSTIQFSASGATYYAWLPKNATLSNPNISNPVAAPVDSVTRYMVYGMSDNGCLDSAAVTITTTGNNNDIVPSAFTPNGDGLNDVFRITNNSFQKLVDFSVYDRRGRVVFKTTDRNKGWDGTYNGAAQDMGVFSYHIVVLQADGNSKTYKGSVTLIR